MRVNLHIDLLVLEGLPVERSQGPRVQAAVETELARLLAAKGVGAELLAGGAMPSVRAGDIQLAAGADPTCLGGQIAQAVFGGLRR
jgi:hypothetical protein